MDREEYERWMESAERTLRSAEKDLAAEEFSWACFKAHQAAEKALKAVLWGSGTPTYGHSLKKLYERLESLLRLGDREVMEDCLRLDKYYTATRYPDVWESGAPEEYFTKLEAEEAIERARRVIRWVQGLWASLRGGEG